MRKNALEKNAKLSNTDYEPSIQHNSYNSGVRVMIWILEEETEAWRG